MHKLSYRFAAYLVRRISQSGAERVIGVEKPSLRVHLFDTDWGVFGENPKLVNPDTMAALAILVLTPGWINYGLFERGLGHIVTYPNVLEREVMGTPDGAVLLVTFCLSPMVDLHGARQ